MTGEEAPPRRSPDGAQMLLLAGFVIAATAIIAIGAFTALQSGSTQIEERTNRPLVDLFLNTRERAVGFFDVVTANDTALSVQENIDGYLFSQYQTAHSMSLQLNASLVGADTTSPLQECPDFVRDADTVADCTGNLYETTDGDDLWSQHGDECYSNVEYDGTNDGLITADDGRVLGALFWLEVEGIDAVLEEEIVIDVPDTEVTASC